MKITSYGSSSAGNCYFIEDKGQLLMLEAGINLKNIKHDISEIDGLLISHEHSDHAKYTKQIIKRCASNLYCTKGTYEGIQDKPDSFRFMQVKSKQAFNINKWRILPFDIEHDALEPIGFLIDTPGNKRILFATDTYYVRYKFNNVTHLMIECNYHLPGLQHNFELGLIDRKRYTRLLTSHFELNNVIQFLKANDFSQLEEVYLLHLSDSNSDANLFKEKIMEVTGVPVYISGSD
ncbi:MBL fold metallo-hydrolase [Facklamia miroungae]|uniref:Phosphoribosyl 1,2-cyclic phosphodiesterase n=1 Tax=Facklamia miroungae TaxID=120956 RepID=A0A1G7NZA0_9LACT|nr:MBL fold metallo-hydrolase [Facklamia miroungae]NKZ28519.1 MBL fold metallo-hydrolase [Facklamia miroungae]SDF79187.1 Phosphoribosyl 1,2-cyclic phosphodiesterase [Facklamia miroungae]